MFTSFESIPRRASELTGCFYCGSALPAKNKEHIFNSSWGGSHKTGDLICNTCNSKFSEKTDLAFSVYVQAVMNSWSFKGERHNEVPKILLGDEYFIDEGAKLKLKRPLIRDTNLPDGQIKSEISFNSKSEAKRWIDGDGMTNWLGRTPSEEEKKSVMKKIIEAQREKIDAFPQKTSTQLDLREQYRSTAHTVLKCLGFFLPEFVQDKLTQEIRDFARNNKGDWRNFAIETKQLFSVAEYATKVWDLGVFQNSVEVYFNSSTKMVVGVLTILNRIKRSVIIARDYSGADSILYVVENTRQTKKPPYALSMKFDPIQIPIPLLNTECFLTDSQIYHYFNNELTSLMGTIYPSDAIASSLINGIEEIRKKGLYVSVENTDECLNLFLEFFQNLSKIFHSPVDINKVRASLLKHGLSDLASSHVGKLYTEPDVDSLMTNAFDSTLHDFQSGVLSTD